MADSALDFINQAASSRASGNADLNSMNAVFDDFFVQREEEKKRKQQQAQKKLQDRPKYSNYQVIDQKMIGGKNVKRIVVTGEGVPADNPEQLAAWYKKLGREGQSQYAGGVVAIKKSFEEKAKEMKPEEAKKYLQDERYQTALATIKALQSDKEIKSGKAENLVHSFNDAVYGGIARSLMRGVGALTELVGFDGAKQNIENFITDNNLEEESDLSNLGQVGKTGGDIVKATSDIASLGLGVGAAQRLAMAGSAGQKLSIADKIGKHLVGSAAGTGISALQDLGERREDELVQNAAIGIGIDVASPVIGKLFRMGKNAVVSTLSRNADEVFEEVSQPATTAAKRAVGETDTYQFIPGKEATPERIKISKEEFTTRFNDLKSQMKSELEVVNANTKSSLDQRLALDEIDARYEAQLDNLYKGKPNPKYKPGAGRGRSNPKFIPYGEKEFNTRLDELTKKMNAEYKKAEGMATPTKSVDEVRAKYQAQIDELKELRKNGIPNPAYQPATPARFESTGFITGEALAEETAERANRHKLHVRIGQIDKAIEDIRSGKIAMDGNKARQLMRERNDAQAVLNGEKSFDDIYGSAGKYADDASTGSKTAAEATNPTAPTLDPGEAVKATRVRQALNKVFSPVSNLPSNTKEAVRQAGYGRNAAKSMRASTLLRIREAAKESGETLNLDLAHEIEAGTKSSPLVQAIRDEADRVRQEAVDAGLDIGYLENYVPHQWKESAEDVAKLMGEEADAMRKAGKSVEEIKKALKVGQAATPIEAVRSALNRKARAEFERKIPSYKEGISLGLTPKYDDPAEMLADYVHNIEVARTNNTLVENLRQQGVLRAGRQPQGWATIDAPGFPRDFQGNALHAPKEIATVLNNLYSNPEGIIDKGLQFGAKANSTWQDIMLSGGIPFTPANFFTLSQIIKSTTGGVGQIVSAPIAPLVGKSIGSEAAEGFKNSYAPLAAFVRSLSPNISKKYQLANAKFLEDLARHGAFIDFGADTATANASRLAKTKDNWGKLFNDPTFNRFMPDLQLSTAKNVYEQLAKKMGREEALALTATTIKRMFGISDQLYTGRDQAVQDLIGTVAFAPKYRESILGVLANTVNAFRLGNLKDSSYDLNRRLMVGLGVTALTYDQMNRAINGHGMFNNPEGRELQLQIPYGETNEDGERKAVYVPFMPSFMTIPRAIVDSGIHAFNGEVGEGVTELLSKTTSTPIQTIAELSNNEDYFGRPIVIGEEEARASYGKEEQDSSLEMLGKQGLYVGGKLLPGWGRAGSKLMQGDPIEEALATGLEAPVRFGDLAPGSSSKESFSPGQVTSDFYDVYNNITARQDSANVKIKALLDKNNPEMAKAGRIAREHNEKIEDFFKAVKGRYGGTPAWNPDWDEMIEGLKIKEDYLDSRVKRYRKEREKKTANR